MLPWPHAALEELIPHAVVLEHDEFAASSFISRLDTVLPSMCTRYLYAA